MMVEKKTELVQEISNDNLMGIGIHDGIEFSNFEDLGFQLGIDSSQYKLKVIKPTVGNKNFRFSRENLLALTLNKIGIPYETMEEDRMKRRITAHFLCLDDAHKLSASYSHLNGDGPKISLVYSPFGFDEEFDLGTYTIATYDERMAGAKLERVLDYCERTLKANIPSDIAEAYAINEAVEVGALSLSEASKIDYSFK